ncbi:MAG: RNA 2',3'-cyclic phosphodiesterase [Thermoplasmatota archaeon]
MTRLFFAVKVPENDAFMELYHELDELGKGVRSVRPGSQHLTLKFIGVPPCSVDEVKKAPEGFLNNYSPFEIDIKNVGAFPNWRRPSVLWLGLESIGKLRKMAVDLDISLNQKCNIHRERRDFRAHITVARIKSPRSIDLISARASMERCLGKLIEDEYTIPVKGFDLIDSELTPDGPVYNVVKEYALGTK